MRDRPFTRWIPLDEVLARLGPGERNAFARRVEGGRVRSRRRRGIVFVPGAAASPPPSRPAGATGTGVGPEEVDALRAPVPREGSEAAHRSPDGGAPGGREHSGAATRAAGSDPRVAEALQAMRRGLRDLSGKLDSLRHEVRDAAALPPAKIATVRPEILPPEWGGQGGAGGPVARAEPPHGRAAALRRLLFGLVIALASVLTGLAVLQFLST